MNIFAELIHSIYDFKSYKGFQENSWPKTLLYGVLLGTIVIFVTLFLPLLMLLVPAGGMEGLAREYVPEFVLEGDEFWIEEPVEYTQYSPGQGNILVKADSDRPITEEMTRVDLLAYDQALVIDAHHVLLKLQGQVRTFTYSEIGIGDWTKERLIKEAMPYIKVIFWGVDLILWWVLLLAFFGGALMIAWIGKLMVSMQGKEISFGSLYKIAIYTRTAPLLLKMIYMWIPVTIPFFVLINMGISCFYMWKAIEVADEDEKPIQIIL